LGSTVDVQLEGFSSGEGSAIGVGDRGPPTTDEGADVVGAVVVTGVVVAVTEGAGVTGAGEGPPNAAGFCHEVCLVTLL